MLALCKQLRKSYSVGALTVSSTIILQWNAWLTFNLHIRMISLLVCLTHTFIVFFIVKQNITEEDQEFLIKNEALETGRIRAVETGNLKNLL